MAIKTGIFGGILAFIIALIKEIPIFPPENIYLEFKLFSFQNSGFYFWGYIINNSEASTSILELIPENLISLLIWFIILFVGLSSIFASTSKAKFYNSIRLFRINILLLILILFIFGTIITFLALIDLSEIFNIIGLGYYLTIIILIFNILALRKLKKE